MMYQWRGGSAADGATPSSLSIISISWFSSFVILIGIHYDPLYPSFGNQHDWPTLNITPLKMEKAAYIVGRGYEHFFPQLFLFAIIRYLGCFQTYSWLVSAEIIY